MNKISNQTVRQYDKLASLYDKKHKYPTFWLKEQKLFKKLIKGRRIIDIGCGPARDGIFFAKNNFDYVGIDASKNMLKIARKKVRTGRFFNMNFYNLRFPENSFDGFWAAASLHLIPKKDVAQVLNSIVKIIRLDGIGFITVKRRKRIGANKSAPSWSPDITSYYHYYSKDEFQKILEKRGFQILKAYYKKKSNGNWLCYFVRKI